MIAVMLAISYSLAVIINTFLSVALKKITLYPYQDRMWTTIMGAKDWAGLVNIALVPNIIDETGAL